MEISYFQSFRWCWAFNWQQQPVLLHVPFNTASYIFDSDSFRACSLILVEATSSSLGECLLVSALWWINYPHPAHVRFGSLRTYRRESQILLTYATSDVFFRRPAVYGIAASHCILHHTILTLQHQIPAWLCAQKLRPLPSLEFHFTKNWNTFNTLKEGPEKIYFC